ncbi:MAG: hypothetical protein AAF081_15870 [Actinomycetota bacterium]
MTDGPIEHPDLQTTGVTWGRVAVVVIVVSLLAMWFWIYLFAPRDNPDRFASPAYAEAAEPICAVAQDEINALPAGRFAETPQERAVGVREGTEITARLVADLKDLRSLVTDPDDLRILDAWFADWEEGYLVDRWAHVERLENATPETDDRDLAFIIQERVEGGFYTRRIDGLANVNDMPSCVVPGDI